MMSSKTLLIPVRFPDPEPLPTSFVGSFTSCRVILLGVYERPSKLDADDRQRRQVEAYHTLYSLANQFVQSGDIAEVDLVMGQELTDAPTRYAEEQDVDALLVPNPITSLSRILIPIRDETFAEPIAGFVGTLNEEHILHTTLLHVTEDESRVEESQEMLSRVREQLVDAGFPDVSIDIDVVVSEDPPHAISEASRGHDLIIMGETEAPTFERVFGKTYNAVAEESDHPVVVVRE